MAIKKEVRGRVWLKYDKHCAYCGKEIEYKQLQVDHIQAHWHTVSEKTAAEVGIKKGAHTMENYNPSCARCNSWKGTFTIEQFREEISQQVERLNKYHSNYRMAKDYGMIVETNESIKFYFEKCQ